MLGTKSPRLIAEVFSFVGIFSTSIFSLRMTGWLAVFITHLIASYGFPKR